MTFRNYEERLPAGENINREGEQFRQLFGKLASRPQVRHGEIYTVRCCYSVVSFLHNSHKRHPIARPLEQGMGCVLWIQHLIDTLPQFVQLFMQHVTTVETLYSTIYYSKYFIELNFDKSTQYVALWTHKRHPIPRPFGRAMECLLWVFQQKLTVL